MPKAESSKRGLVSVLDKKGNHAGFGVYIGDDFILTCAHVLQEKDGGPVLPKTLVRFEAVSAQTFSAKVVKAQPPVLQEGLWLSGDVALLKLDTCAPAGAQAAPLVIPDSLPDNWLVFGHSLDNPNITSVNGTLQISHPLPELRGPINDPIAIEPGFSGSPVFDETADQVLGLVRSGIRRWEKHGKEEPVRQSYMLPVKTMVNELKSAELEDRLSSKFIRLSTAEKRRNHSEEICKRIKREWKELSIQATFDYRIGAAKSFDEIREIHHQSVIESYPNTQEASAAFCSVSDFLRDLAREERRLDSAIFHLQAPGGSGKSLFARDLVQKALAYLIVPYCIDLKQSQQAVAGSGDQQTYDLEALFKGTIAGGAKLLQEDLDDSRLCLLLADGLNETASAAQKWLALLREQSENYSNLRILVCDRIIDRSSDLPHAQLLTVRPLSKEAINTAMKDAGGKAVTDPKFLDLVSTPFFLHLALPSHAGKQPAGVQGNTRIEMFKEYFRMALKLLAPDEGSTSIELRSSLQTLSGIAYQAYAAKGHLFLDTSLWKDDLVKQKLEQAGAILVVKQAGKEDRFVFRHQLLHDYLAGYYLAQHAPPDYSILHDATWRGENPEPVNFALEIVETTSADDFLNHVYDWNYSVTIGCLRDIEESGRSSVSGFFKAAVAALIALKTADHFMETRRAGERDLGIFNKGLAGIWREAVTAPQLTDVAKIQNLLHAVQEKFDPTEFQGAQIVDYGLWKTMFCRTNQPIRGEERLLFVDNPLIGWTAANSFRRTGIEPWFLDRLIGAYRALREAGIANSNGRQDPAARVVRRRIVYILGIAQDDETVGLLEQAVFKDPKEDDDVKDDGLRALLEIASKQPSWRDRIVKRIADDMEKLSPRGRRRILKSHRVVTEEADWLARMLELIKRGGNLEPEERYKAEWESAKDKLEILVKS